MVDPTVDLLLTAISKGLEQAFRLYYGIYRAAVVDNKDDQQRGRVRVHLHSLGQSAPSDQWIDPITIAGPDRGWYFPPDIGDWVWVFFDQGNASRPIAYLPMGYGSDEKPDELGADDSDAPVRRGIVTRLGHQLIFSDEPDQEYVRMVWHRPGASDPAKTDPSLTADRTDPSGKTSVLELTKEGGFQVFANNGKFVISYDPPKDADKAQVIIMDNDNGNSMTFNDDGILFLDKAGNSFGLQKGKFVIIAEKGITVTGQGASFSTGGASLGYPASMSGVCGEPLLAWLASHTHPTAGVGPPSPPVVPPSSVILSRSVKLKT